MNELADTVSNDVSLLAVMRFLRRHIATIAVCTVLFGALAGVLAFAMTLKYRSEVVLAPADSASSLGGLGGQLGGLASLAGISLGGGNKKSEEALEYLRSRAFTAAFIERHALMPVLYAKQWDAAHNRWRNPEEAPTIAQAVARFSKSIRQVTEDKRTGIVTVSVIWKDRQAAAQWANALVAEADQALRERAIAQQARSIEYLQAEAAQTSTVEIATAISKVMETELKNAMIARTRDAYAFEVIDPAVVADRKDWDSPNRPLIILLGAGFGFTFGVAVAGIRQSRRRRH